MLKELSEKLGTFEFRPYQDRIVQKIVNYYTKENLQNILVEAPTGSGKTLTSLAAVRILQDLEPSLKVTWVCMRRNLLAQADNENRSKKFNCNINFISMFQEKELPETDLLIIDEAQHDSTNSCSHIHNVLKPRWVLGQTATPFRSDRIKLCFDKVITDAGIGELIKLGYLSPYNHYTIPVWSPEDVCKFYLREPEKWGKSLIFFHQIKTCETASDILADAGVKVDIITGSTDKEEQIKAFKNGKTDVVLNCLVLTEGFDFPALNTVFCRPSCKGITVQICGRVFRKFPGIPVKNIVQCTKTAWPFLRTATPIRQSKWHNEEWVTIEGNNNVEIATKNTVHALAGIKVELPKGLKKKPRRRNIRIN